ncbi:isoprenylcysteine carboxyl methyltransferase family protein [Streptosporangium sp. NBC_01810]|uniref:isoprenylcysteine carboxyl methyltransferase family protein n=1 Tax=Streptosporangium sp. NBC_01810 TaxID=2975951 RepID=UPI002DDA2509|nr:isoprenylcysteine carboxyl methyltransferase family protein [Streptosporangium sp. NBC_01810]WSA29144.1 isoprenylcysteine carboxyl methyltransferase family protein [Streptosporangium sp. NBC_01810]
MSWHLSSWYLLLLLLVGLERVAELVVARRNARWSTARGGVTYGRGHYPWMVALHTGLLAGCLLEAGLADRPFEPALGWPMLALVVAAQGLRWWCVVSLGPQWNTQVIVVPGLPLVERGPYRLRLLRHPNYVAVAVEGAALPLVYGAWVTALAFTVLNAALMTVRIHCEEDALASLVTAPSAGAPAATVTPTHPASDNASPTVTPVADAPPSAGRAPA